MKKTLLLIFILILSSLRLTARPRGQIVCIDNSVFVAFCEVEGCEPQQRDNWCWAACIRMIMKGYGERQSQSDIVGLVYGYSYDWTATGSDIARAFDGWNGWRAKTFKQKSAQILIDELASHGPIMIGTEEHAYLLTHIYYTENRAGEATPFKAILINPTTAREEIRDWTDLFPAINTIVALFKE